MSEFQMLLKKISAGCELHSDEILPHITRGDLKERTWINNKLAEAFFEVGKYEQAKVFIQRSWLFSEFDERYLPLYIKINDACDDIHSIKQAHKELGMKKSDSKKISQAIKHFNDWQYTSVIHRNEDEYHYDLEILNRIDKLAEPYALPPKPFNSIINRKIRLAYLMFGMTTINSVIVKINLLFAKYHDPDLFDVTFYVPEQSSTILNCPEAVNKIKEIEKLGWKVVLAPNSMVREKSLISLSESIHQSSHDILITSAALADFNHYFISALKPAPCVVGLCSGPPPQFISPNFDWSITWFRSTLIECPTDCSLVNLRIELPDRMHSRKEAKSNYNINSESFVVMTCGRPPKLQNIDFLNSLISFIKTDHNINLVIVGIKKLPNNLLDEIEEEVRKRIFIFGWEKSFHELLSMADVVVDTYPSGGGVVIKDTMSLGTPVISFKHNHMKSFSQKEWSVAEETFDIPELLIERGDFESLKNILQKIFSDEEYRNNLSQICKKKIIETSGNAELMVKECEKIYLNVLQKKQPRLQS